MPRLRSIVQAVSFFLVCVAISGPGQTQTAPLAVSVDDHVYLVNNGAVAGKLGSEPVDGAITEKARFAARVLDEHILRSDYNKVHYNAVGRAIVYADAFSERLIEPWRWSLIAGSVQGPSQDVSFDEARTAFRAWSARLASDPAQLTLAIVRKDYLDGIGAYKENAVIFRNVTKRNELFRSPTPNGSCKISRNPCNWPMRGPWKRR